MCENSFMAFIHQESRFLGDNGTCWMRPHTAPVATVNNIVEVRAAFRRARNSRELPGKQFLRNILSHLRVDTSGRSRESNAPFPRRVAPQHSRETHYRVNACK